MIAAADDDEEDEEEVKDRPVMFLLTATGRALRSFDAAAAQRTEEEVQWAEISTGRRPAEAAKRAEIADMNTEQGLAEQGDCTVVVSRRTAGERRSSASTDRRGDGTGGGRGGGEESAPARTSTCARRRSEANVWGFGRSRAVVEPALRK